MLVTFGSVSPWSCALFISWHRSLQRWWRRVAVRPLSWPRAGRPLPPPLDGLGSAVRLVWPFMVGLPHEEVRVLLVDADCRVIGFPRIAVGGAHAVVFTVGDVLRPALQRGAVGIVLVHNHPAGPTLLSPADRAVTARLLAMTAALSLIFIDHLIVGQSGVFSFRQHGRLPPLPPVAPADPAPACDRARAVAATTASSACAAVDAPASWYTTVSRLGLTSGRHDDGSKR